MERHFPNKPPSAHPNLGPDDLKALIDSNDPVVETIHYQKKRAKDGWNFNVYMKQGIAIKKKSKLTPFVEEMRNDSDET